VTINMGALWTCLAAKLASSGAVLEADGNRVDFECCNCRKEEEETPQQRELTNVTLVPSEYLSYETVPPDGTFERREVASPPPQAPLAIAPLVIPVRVSM